ncbi:MAG: TRAP transporter permease, partial [Geminicoccaceae bacterium]
MSSPLKPGDDPAGLVWGPGRVGLVAYGIAIAFSAFQLWTAAYSPLPSQIVRSVHVGFLLLLTFALLSNSRGDSGARSWLDWGLGIVSFAVGLYHWVFYEQLILRAGDPNTADILVGVLAVLLVFEASRRLMGPSLPIICAAFLAYALFGQHLPSPLNHRG